MPRRDGASQGAFSRDGRPSRRYVRECRPLALPPVGSINMDQTNWTAAWSSATTPRRDVALLIGIEVGVQYWLEFQQSLVRYLRHYEGFDESTNLPVEHVRITPA